MMKDLFSRREREIFETLDALSDCDFVVIGGYAVNAYTLPRFSVDCDIVAKGNSELRKIGAALSKNGFKIVESKGETQYSGGFLRFSKKLEDNLAVSIDLFASTVTDRMTGAVFSAEWIIKNSRRIPLQGKTIAEELRVKIIGIDALIVMKVVSCRDTDIRDVFMMFPNSKDREWIKSEVKLRCDFNERISKLIERVTSKQFKDGLSGVYGYLDEAVFEKHKGAILSFNED